jgi:hypothetical protein
MPPVFADGEPETARRTPVPVRGKSRGAPELSSVDEDRRHIALLYDRFDADRAAAERELLALQRAAGSSPGERALRLGRVELRWARR